jgi:hypothetical protein
MLIFLCPLAWVISSYCTHFEASRSFCDGDNGDDDDDVDNEDDGDDDDNDDHDVYLKYYSGKWFHINYSTCQTHKIRHKQWIQKMKAFMQQLDRK